MLVPALSRAGMVLAITAFPYVRPEGLGRTFKDHSSRADLVSVSVVTLLAAVLILRGAGLLLWVTAVVVTLAAGWFFNRRLGGLTGDTYGAIAMIDEVVLFLVLAAMRPE
jgi:adenosylcobinamide-GDP ribazoletransferase